MPELPEVETVTNALRPHLLGRRILRVETFADRLRYPLDLEWERVVGPPIVAVRRRGRYTLVQFEGRRVLLIHLGMTGSSRIVDADQPRRPHDHVFWHLDNGRTWRFHDPRKFGILAIHDLAPGSEDPACLASLGPEPLGEAFTGAYLHAVTRGRSGPIKPLLMDNARVTGIGNIYASEALYRAAILPRTRAGRLSLGRCNRLVEAVREVLAEAIEAGGTTINDFEAPDGSEGRFARRLDVYGREGEPCRRCGKGPIRRSVLSGRSTYYCPDCQH